MKSPDAVHDAILALFGERRTTSLRTSNEEECANLIDSRYRMIRLDEDSPSKFDLAFLSPEFLATAARGSAAVGEATFGTTDEAKSGISFRSKALIAAIAAGSGRIFSPFTGQIEPVYTSLGREWYFHAHDGRYCLASQMGDTMTAVDVETLWVFPQESLILYVVNFLSETDMRRNVASQYARCINRAGDLISHLSGESNGAARTRSLALTDFSCPHLGHNFWNVLTGWSNLFAGTSVASIDRFVLHENQNLFGSLQELFPESCADGDRISWVKNDDDIFEEMLTRNLLLLTVKDQLVMPDLARRVLDRARAGCSRQFLEEVDRLRAAANPLIVTTIRLDNRAWIEQRDGLPSLFAKLRTEFPKLGLVLDGLSSDTVKGWSTDWMSLEDELEVASAVRAALPSEMPVEFSVGKTLAESIILSDSADLFIAPIGSGMTMYKWISNLPGLTYSNRAVLARISRRKWTALRVWDNPRFRHDVTPTAHLSADFVEDTESARGHETRANFNLDWNDLYEAAAAFIRDWAAKDKGEPEGR